MDALFKAEPELLNGDPQAAARAAGAVTFVLGTLMGGVLRHDGVEVYDAIFRDMLCKVDASAHENAGMGEIVADLLQSRTRH